MRFVEIGRFRLNVLMNDTVENSKIGPFKLKNNFINLEILISNEFTKHYALQKQKRYSFNSFQNLTLVDLNT